MSLFRRVMARVFRLPPAETHDLQIERNLRIPLPDGVVLLADHYTPRSLGPRPTVLTRSVYTDRTKGGWISALIAERGFHVLVVSGRGTVGSGGTLNPFRHEHDDGMAVLAWMQQQPWFTGVLGTTGASYLGYTQWAIARDAGSMLQAMSTQRADRVPSAMACSGYGPTTRLPIPTAASGSASRCGQPPIASGVGTACGSRYPAARFPAGTTTWARVNRR